MTAFWIIAGYLAILILLGVLSNLKFRGTQVDYFLASRGVGPFMLFMSLFGTTMTAFAMVGSSGEASKTGIGVFGMMASWSGIIHSLCFFLIGVKLWSFGKRHGYVTQIQFFRDRFESSNIGLVLFPIIVGMMIPYLLVGVLGLGTVMTKSTAGAFPNLFPSADPLLNGAVPGWVGMGTICGVVLVYVFFGGVRSTLWINAFQNLLFLTVGVYTMFVIADKLGGAANATEMVRKKNPHLLRRAILPEDIRRYDARLSAFERGVAAAPPIAAAALPGALKPAEPGADATGRTPPPPGQLPSPASQPGAGAATRPTATIQAAKPRPPVRPEGITPLAFLSYGFIPLSVAMFPHLFQYYLTAKSAKSFKLSVIMHPIFILVLWLPCVLLGVWATSAVKPDGSPVIPPNIDPNGVLAAFVKNLTGPVLGGLMAASILATNSLDAQFLCLGAMFTNDIVAHHAGKKRFSEKQLVMLGRAFVVGVVVVTYVISLWAPRGVFQLGTWCFAGYASLAPLLIASIYWKRVTKAGAYASILASGASWWWFFYESNFGADERYAVWGMHPVAPIVAVATAALVLVSLMSRPPSDATLAKFFSASAGEAPPANAPVVRRT